MSEAVASGGVTDTGAGGAFADLVAESLIRAVRHGVVGALESHLAAATY